MPKLPRDIGSKQLTEAFKRLGFKRSNIGDGSHRGWYKKCPDGTTIVVPLMEGKSKGEIPVGTLANILRLADVSLQEFLDAL